MAVVSPLTRVISSAWLIAALVLPTGVASADDGNRSFVGVWASGPTAAEAAMFDELHVGWARLAVTWSTIEPRQGELSWTALDQQMAMASGGGRRTVLALVRNNPSWAAANQCRLTTDAERQRFATFVGRLANRYKGVVWQFYNEVDNTSVAADAMYDLGGCFGTVDQAGMPTVEGPTNYARTLEAASTAVRTVDPAARLAAGGVASGGFTDLGGAFDRGFLPAVLSQLKVDEALPSIDYITVHYYSSQAGTYATAGTDIVGRVAQLRRDALATGLIPEEVPPVISDELSYTGSVGTSTADAADAFNVAQAAYVPQLLARAAASGLRAALWFLLQDSPSGLGSDNAYGLRDRTGQAKPAYTAMRYFNEHITSATAFVDALDLSATSTALEGYRFTGADGRELQLIWANPAGAAGTSTYVYAPICAIADVRDVLGATVEFSTPSNSLSVGTAPRYVFCG
jgi:Beta-galactosidase